METLHLSEREDLHEAFDPGAPSAMRYRAAPRPDLAVISELNFGYASVLNLSSACTFSISAVGLEFNGTRVLSAKEGSIKSNSDTSKFPQEPYMSCESSFHFSPKLC